MIIFKSSFKPPPNQKEPIYKKDQTQSLGIEPLNAVPVKIGRKELDSHENNVKHLILPQNYWSFQMTCRL